MQRQRVQTTGLLISTAKEVDLTQYKALSVLIDFSGLTAGTVTIKFAGGVPKTFSPGDPALTLPNYLVCGEATMRNDVLAFSFGGGAAGNILVLIDVLTGG